MTHGPGKQRPSPGRFFPGRGGVRRLGLDAALVDLTGDDKQATREVPSTFFSFKKTKTE